MSVATLTVLALRASIEQVGTHLLCLLPYLFPTYKALRTLENTRKIAEKDAKK